MALSADYLTVLRFHIKKIFALIVLLSFWHSEANSQAYSQEFNPSIVPVKFELVHSIAGDVIISVPQENGIWMVERKDLQNNSKWNTKIELDEKEVIFSSIIVDTKIYFFSTRFNLNTGLSELFKRTLDLGSGRQDEKSLMWTKTSQDILRNRKKAKRIADAELELASLKSSNSEVPLRFRYEVKQSPNKKFVLVSFFDYSQKNLIHSYSIYTSDLKKLHSKDLSLDELIYFYDYGIDDEGSLYHLNQTFNGDIQIIRFAQDSEDYDLLTLTAENSQRDDLKLLILDNGRIVVAAKAEIENSFYGCLYAIFDFNTIEIDRIHFETLPIEFKDASDSLYQAGKLEVRDWTNYTLNILESFNDEELLIVFEAFDLRRSGYSFRDLKFSSELEWVNHKSKFISGPAMVFSFDKNDELRWSKYIYKKVEMDMTLPSVSNFFSAEPNKEKISFFINNESGSFQYEMDYIYNSWQKVESLTENRLLTIKESTNGNIYLIYFSEKDSKLYITTE